VLLGAPGTKILRHGDQADFGHYYAAARLMARGEDPNDIRSLRAEAARHGLEVGGAVPQLGFPAIALMVPVGLLEPRTAMWVWLGAGALCLAVGVGITIAAASRLTLGRFGPGLLLATTFVPALWALYLGQISQLMVPFVALGYLAYVRRRPALAGFAIAMAAAVKPLPALLLVHFALRRQWRAFAGFGATVAGAVVGSMVWLGPGYPVRWLHHLSYWTTHPEGSLHAVLSHNQSLYGAVQRMAEVGIRSWGGELVPPIAPGLPGGVVLAAGGGIILVCWALASVRMARGGVTAESACLEFAMTIAVAFILSPLAMEHHMCILVVPLVVCMLGWRGGRRLRAAATAAIAVYVLAGVGRPAIWYLEFGRPQLLAGMATEHAVVAAAIFIVFSLPLLGVVTYWLGNTIQCFSLGRGGGSRAASA
jgi:hypothetical protein